MSFTQKLGAVVPTNSLKNRRISNLPLLLKISLNTKEPIATSNLFYTKLSLDRRSVVSLLI